MPTPTYVAADALPTPSFTTPLASGTGFDPWAIPDPAVAEGLLYFFFGPRQRNLVYDGTVLKTMGIVAPSALPTLAAGTGAMTGSFWVTHTYEDASAGIESGPAADLTTAERWRNIVVTAQGIDVTIADPPAASSRVTNANIYISLRGGGSGTLTMKYYGTVVVTPGAGGTHVVTIDTTDAILAPNDPLNTAKRYYPSGLPPASWTAAYYNGRMFTVDPDNPLTVCYSEEGLPQDVPAENIITVYTAPDDTSTRIESLRVNNDRLWAYTAYGGYEISGDAPLYKVYPAFSNAGTLSTYATRFIGGVGVVFPGRDNPWVHVGENDVRPLGAPNGNPGANPLEDLYLASDYGTIPYSVASVDVAYKRIRFAVPALGDAVCDTTFVWEYSGNDWGEDTGRRVVSLGTWTDQSGRTWPVRGDDMGAVWQDDMGNSEGCFDGVVTGTITAGAAFALTVSGLTAASVVAGAPVIVRDTAGLVVARNRAISYSGTTLTVMYRWASIPSSGTVEVGAIEGVWQSGIWDGAAAGVRDDARALLVSMKTQTGGTFDIYYGVNQPSSLTVLASAVSLAQHQALLYFNDMGNVWQFRFENSAPGSDDGYRGYRLVRIDRGSFR